MIDRSHVGRTWPPFEVEVDKSRLRLFAKSIGEQRPEYHDETAAQRLGHRSLLAPPTFGYCLGADDPAGLQFLDDLGIPIGRMLHAEVSLVHHQPIVAGDRLTVTRRVADIFAKKSGALEFVRFEMAIRDARDERLVMECVSTLAIRWEVTA